MKIKIAAGMAGLLLMAAVPMLAHHSFAAEYDSKAQRDFKGVVTKIEWMNPHVRFYVDVKDESGKVRNWEFELGNPSGLMRRGWTRSSMKVGDEVNINAYLAKDGSALANARTVGLNGGKKLFAGSADDGAPPEN
jgi:uncharacterized protein DUF6152